MSDATESYTVRWFHPRDGNGERSVPTQAQLDVVLDEIRSDSLVSEIIVEHVESHRRWTVTWWEQLARRQGSREFDTREEALVLAEERRQDPFSSDVRVRTSPVVRRHRARVLDATGRPI